jgi:hypothetical protein
MAKNEKERLIAAANMVSRQAAENPGLGIPVDPDVAEFMGAFEGNEDLLDVIQGAEEADHG